MKRRQILVCLVQGLRRRCMTQGCKDDENSCVRPCIRHNDIKEDWAEMKQYHDGKEKSVTQEYLIYNSYMTEGLLGNSRTFSFLNFLLQNHLRGKKNILYEE